jgi:thioredoxin 1
LGLAIGAAVGAFLKSRGGACPLTCNPIGGAIFGALLGFIVTWPTASSTQAFATIDHFTTVGSVDEFDSEVLAADRLVLVDFYSPRCPPCKRLAPVLGALSQDYPDRVKFTKVNVDDAPAVRDAYNVRGWPTLMLVRDGEVVDRWMGYTDKESIAARIDAALAAEPGGSVFPAPSPQGD